jgi:hypothetical protein
MGCGGDWISVTPPERRAEQIARQTYRVADRTLTVVPRSMPMENRAAITAGRRPVSPVRRYRVRT